MVLGSFWIQILLILLASYRSYLSTWSWQRVFMFWRLHWIIALSPKSWPILRDLLPRNAMEHVNLGWTKKTTRSSPLIWILSFFVWRHKRRSSTESLKFWTNLIWKVESVCSGYCSQISFLMGIISESTSRLLVEVFHLYWAELFFYWNIWMACENFDRFLGSKSCIFVIDIQSHSVWIHQLIFVKARVVQREGLIYKRLSLLLMVWIFGQHCRIYVVLVVTTIWESKADWWEARTYGHGQICRIGMRVGPSPANIQICRFCTRLCNVRTYSSSLFFLIFPPFSFRIAFDVA